MQKRAVDRQLYRLSWRHEKDGKASQALRRLLLIAEVLYIKVVNVPAMSEQEICTGSGKSATTGYELRTQAPFLGTLGIPEFRGVG
jgi:hypothetical protein